MFQGKSYKFFGPLKAADGNPKFVQLYVHDPHAAHDSARLRLCSLKLPSTVSPFECETLHRILQDLQVSAFQKIFPDIF